METKRTQENMESSVLLDGVSENITQYLLYFTVPHLSMWSPHRLHGLVKINTKKMLVKIIISRVHADSTQTYLNLK
jgi:hypothetical protein